MKMIVFNKLLICVVDEVVYKLKRNKDIYRCIRPADGLIKRLEYFLVNYAKDLMVKDFCP